MEEEPPVITAIDYLHQLNQLEQEAKDTYPARIDSCSFRLGYRTQPVYSCLSENCREKASPAGFCYACSVSCHTDHKVIELFTKRHFRCDCGTKNSPNTPCCLITAPDDERKQTTGSVVNEENEYNHNFDGRYCWCDREYDPYSEEGTMFQCVLCHDWRHENCIGLIPPESSFVDYVCRTCVSDTKLLKRYRGIHFIAGISKPDGVVERLEGYDGKQTRACEESVDIREAAVKNTEIKSDGVVERVEGYDGKETRACEESVDIREAAVKKTEISETYTNRNSTTKDDITVQKTDIPEAQVEKIERSETHSMRNSVGEETSSSKESSATPKRLRTLPRGFSPRNSPKYRLGCPATPTTGGSIKRLAVDDLRDTEHSTPTKRSRVSTSEYGGCCLADMPEVGANENVDLFCRDGWREALCQCSRCMSEYKSTIKLLTEHAEEYEPEVDEDDDEDPSIFERGMKALQAMPRSTQVDGVMAYNKMRDEIKGFLRGFAMSGEIVKKEDVKKFFDERQEKMRERRV